MVVKLNNVRKLTLFFSNRVNTILRVKRAHNRRLKNDHKRKDIDIC